MNELTWSRFKANLRKVATPMIMGLPQLTLAQTSPFMTGASALQTNILAWLTPIAVIIVMALGAMAMANRIIENCGSSLILRCSSSEGGGTSRFASTLIGQREIARRTLSHSRRHGEMLGSSTSSEHFSIEPAVMDSEIEQLPDLTGYLKFASQDRWQRVTLRALHRGATAEAVPAVPAYVPVCRAAELAPDAQCATSGDTRKYNATDSAEKRPGLRRRSDRMPQTFTRSRSTTVSSQAKTLAREPPEQTL